MRSGVMIIMAAAVMTTPLYPCDVVTIGRHPHKVDLAKTIVRGADVIVRATALEYAVPPEVSDYFGVKRTSASGSIRFDVIEVMRGRPLRELILAGELVDRDDFNRSPPPYQGARPNAGGSCWAWPYKTGAQYLLMLEKEHTGGLTLERYPLAPVNEQLHSDDDPWLLWVRTRAKAGGFLHRR
jgi:hypothetical protein